MALYFHGLSGTPLSPFGKYNERCTTKLTELNFEEVKLVPIQLSLLTPFVRSYSEPELLPAKLKTGWSENENNNDIFSWEPGIGYTSYY